MTSSFFAAFGLHLHSDLHIPGAQPTAAQPAPDVTVTLAQPSQDGVGSVWPGGEAQALAGSRSGPYALAPGSLLFTVPSVAGYLCGRPGDSITLYPQPGTPQELVAEYLIATALPALLWCRGATVLHAAAAVLPGQSSATALAGASGVGKSTLLRRLLATGAAVVADDSVALCSGDSGQPMASGLPAATRLANQTEPARFVAVPPSYQQAKAPLTRLVELVGGAGPKTPERQLGPAALAVLLRNLHRPRVPHLLGQDATLLRRLASFAGSLAIYRWSAEDALHCSPADLVRTLEL